jgi:hypothetical protein
MKKVRLQHSYYLPMDSFVNRNPDIVVEMTLHIGIK